MCTVGTMAAPVSLQPWSLQVPLQSFAGHHHGRDGHPRPPVMPRTVSHPGTSTVSRHVGSDTPGLPPQTTRCCTDRTDCSREPDLGKLLAHLRPVDSSALASVDDPPGTQAEANASGAAESNYTSWLRFLRTQALLKSSLVSGP